MTRAVCSNPDCGNIVLGTRAVNAKPLCRGCAGEKRRADKASAKVASLPRDEAGVVAYCKRRQWRLDPDLGGGAWIFDKLGNPIGCADTPGEALRNAVSGDVFGDDSEGGK